MDPEHALYAQPRSMSCEYGLGASGARDSPSNPGSLETAINTVLPQSSHVSPVTRSPSRTSPECQDRLPLESLVPLPPSPPGSEANTQELQELEDTEVCQEILPRNAPPPNSSYEPPVTDHISPPSPNLAHEQTNLDSRDENAHEDIMNLSREERAEDMPTGLLVEEGPGLRTLGIPSDDAEGQDTPTQDVAQLFPSRLEPILDIFRWSRREAERCASLKHTVYHKLHQHGGQRKLAPVLAHRYQQLVRCHREDYAPEFVSLFTEFPDEKTGAIPPLEPISESWLKRSDENPREPTQWTERLTAPSRESLLRLVTLIRSDEDFLSTKVARLSPTALDHLCRLHHHHPSSMEMPGGLNRPFGAMPSRPPSRMSNMSESFDSLDDIHSNPLHVLTHSIFDWSQRPDSAEGLRRESVWASVCAKMINQDVYGADRFVVAVLNEFALTEPWIIAPQFETLVLEWIQSGFFILDPDSFPAHRTESEEVRKSRIAVAQTRFLETALEQLLHLLTKNLDQSVPIASLNLCRSILARVEPEKRERAQHLLVTGWYCQSFLQTALICPESHGILDQQHVRRDARTRLFYGIYARLLSTIETVRVLQQQEQGSLASAYAMAGVRKLIAAFEQAPKASTTFQTAAPSTGSGARFIGLTVPDVLSIIKVLYPYTEKSPELSGGSVFGRAFSATSSILGVSRATTTGTLTPMFGTRSSFAPSTSSTSITSDTFFSDNAAGADIASMGISDGTSMPFTPGGSINGTDDQIKHTTLFRELLSLKESLSSKLTRDGRRSTSLQSNRSESNLSVLFVGDEGVSLQEPRAVEASANDSEHQNPNPEDVYTQVPLYDVLQLAVSEMTADKTCALHELLSSEDAIDSIGKYLGCKKHELQNQYNFVAAHRVHQSMLVYEQAPLDQKRSLLQSLIDQSLRDIDLHESLCGMYRSWVDELKTKEEDMTKRIKNTASNCRALRDKQWFSSMVCHSSVYRDSSNIAKALATMATGKPAKHSGLSGWAKRNLKLSFGSEKAFAQSLALLATKRQYGGPNKLTDGQAELTANWLSNNKVENFCSGEERVHRFCYEIKRCTQKLVADSMIASPVLWSSNLYEREKAGFGGLQSQQQRSTWTFSSASSSPTTRQGGFTQIPAASANASKIFPFSLSPPHSRQATGIRDFATHQPQTNRPSVLDPSFRFSTTPENALGLQTPWALPPSPISPNLASGGQEQPKLSPQQAEFLENLRRTVTSLLLSDLGLLLWTNGTETDRWVNEERLHHESISVKIGSPSHPDLTQLARSPPAVSTADPGIELYRWQRETSEAPENQQLSDESLTTQAKEQYPYKDAYTRLLNRFRVQPGPMQKLAALHELIRLIALAPSMPDETPDTESYDLASLLRTQYASGLPDRSLPRTRLTKLQEVTVNCEERRMQSLVMTPIPTCPSVDNQQPWIVSRASHAAGGNESIGDAKVSQVIRALLLDRAFYPGSLFRDLQMISAFVPSVLLDSTPQGTSFWTLSLAAMQLKSTLCAAMVDRAAQITNFHVDRGNKAREPVRQDRIDSERSNRNNRPDKMADSAASAERHRAASPNRNYQSRTLSELELKSTSLADAGRLFQIAAAEGDPAAARELGLFYLTHPEHVRRTLIPLSKPGEVASMAGAAPGQPERGGGIGANPYAQKAQASATRGKISQLGDDEDEMNLDDPEVSLDGRDPSNLATAWHWMEFAAGGGDEQANTFLANNTELR